jgi:serine/threonine protein kinase
MSCSFRSKIKEYKCEISRKDIDDLYNILKTKNFIPQSNSISIKKDISGKIHFDLNRLNHPDVNTITDCELIKTILPSKLKLWSVIKIMGKGSFGVVILIKRNKKIRVVKLVFDDGRNFQPIETEYQMAKLAEKIKIGPQIDEIYQISNTTGKLNMYIIIQEALDMELEDLIRCIIEEFNINQNVDYLGMNLKNILKQMTKLFHKMKRNKFTHGDLSINNIMVKFSPNSSKHNIKFSLKFIDFGLSVKDLFLPEIDVARFLFTCNDVFPSFKDYFINYLENVLKEEFPNDLLRVTNWKWTKKEYLYLFDEYLDPRFEIIREKYKEKIKRKLKNNE